MSNYVNELERENNDLHYRVNQLEDKITELEELIDGVVLWKRCLADVVSEKNGRVYKLYKELEGILEEYE